MSIITFNLTEGLDETGALQGSAYGCDYDVNAQDNVLEGYTGVINSTCSYCADVCVAPDVDTKIGFFDGFNFKLWSLSYLVFIIISASLFFWDYRQKASTKEKVDKINQECANLKNKNDY